MNIVIVGTGYVGLVTGVGFAEQGHNVSFIDLDSSKIQKLEDKQLPFFEPDLGNYFEKDENFNRMSFHSNYESLDWQSTDIVFICVQTPNNLETNSVDTKFLESAILEISKLENKDITITVKSTIPPYEIENVRVNYYGENNAKGYARGVDLKINGEFVKGIQSYASLSWLQTSEDIIDDGYYNYFNADGEKIIPGYTLDNTPTDSVLVQTGFIPRPTDQRVNFSLFFQDYVPNNPNYKMHLNLKYGSGLPFGPPKSEKYEDILRIPSYRRVDIGFSAGIKSSKKVSRFKFLNYFEEIWLSAEVFNLLDINNTVSYIWVNDINGRQYAVPNYLTSRQLNARLIIKI